MTFSMKESFSWMTPDMLINDAPGKSIGLRGQALYSYEKFPELGISSNLKKYIEDEVREGARTLQNKPVDVNHQYYEWVNSGKVGKKPVIAGNVEYGYYEDSVIEYFAKINNQEYINKLKDTDKVRKGGFTEEAYRKKWGKGPIRGVSVEADFLHMRCVHCGDKFYDFKEFQTHMGERHAAKEIIVEPHGIFFKGLSLVEDPAVPGVKGTTFEIMETSQPMIHLYEMLVTDVQERMTYQQEKEKRRLKENKLLDKSGIALQSDTHLAFGKSTVSEQDEPEPCPEGQHRNEEGECVPDEPVQEQDEACPEGQHRNEEGECVPDVAEQEECPEGQHRNEAGECVPDVAEQEECPEGQHRDENGECVPDKVEEQETPSCPEGQHRDPLTGECVDNTPLQEQEELPPFAVTCPEGQHLDPKTNTCVPNILEPITVEPPVGETPAALETLTLGEPFADYDSFEDCVSKNADKDDPAAYCAEIKGQTEETKEVKLGAALQTDTSTNPIPLSYRRMIEKRELKHKHQHEDITCRLKKLDEAVDCNNATFKALKTGIQSLRKQQSRIAGKINEVIKTRQTPKPADFTPIIDAINETRSILNKQDVEQALKISVIQKTTQKSIRATANKLAVLESALKKQLIKIQAVTSSTKTHPTITSQITALTKSMQKLPQLQTKFNTFTETVNSQITNQTEAVTELTGKVEEFNTAFAKAAVELTGKVEEFSTASTASITELTGKVEEQGKEYAKFKEVVNSEYEQVKKDNDAKLAEKDSTINELKGKLKEAANNTVKETENLTTKVENLTEMMKSMPQYKGTQKNIVTPSELDAPKPWEGES